MTTSVQTSGHVYAFGSVVYDLSRRTYLMGILNVTPDSFSDGGRFIDIETAVRHGMQMVEEGADFIDVGGESTRPGSEPVPLEEELRRVLPVITRLAKSIPVPISIDTYKSTVARQAVEAGATIINDISALRYDPAIAEVAAEYRASLVLMHLKGTPRTMQQDPQYSDVVREVRDYLREGTRLAQERGVNQIFVDPGIGFGKNLEHNLELLRRLREFHALGYPVLVGPSRKSFIGTVLDLPVTERLEGTAAAVASAIMNGASVVRVHDVKPLKRVAAMMDAIVGKKILSPS